MPGILVTGKIKLEGNDRSKTPGHGVHNKKVLKEKQSYKTRFMLKMKN